MGRTTSVATRAGAVAVGALLAACTPGAPAADPTFSADPALAPAGETVVTQVVRVVDGDTVRVVVDGVEQPLRLIGIDTPETVKPDSPIECFGPEASDFATAVLDGREVIVEFDAGQGREDRFGRLLGYVWIADAEGRPTLFNLEAVRGGFAVAREYGDVPARWAPALAAAERSAVAAGAGLWSACPEDERP